MKTGDLCRRRLAIITKRDMARAGSPRGGCLRLAAGSGMHSGIQPGRRSSFESKAWEGTWRAKRPVELDTYSFKTRRSCCEKGLQAYCCIDTYSNTKRSNTLFERLNVGQGFIQHPTKRLVSALSSVDLVGYQRDCQARPLRSHRRKHSKSFFGSPQIFHHQRVASEQHLGTESS